MGVFYPPHAVLYRVLSTESAYTASLVLHTYFAALGAYWAARQFGVSSWGSSLSGFAWSASGLFVIHLPHQWGYTTGAWMPWTVGLGWRLASATTEHDDGARACRPCWRCRSCPATSSSPSRLRSCSRYWPCGRPSRGRLVGDRR